MNTSLFHLSANLLQPHPYGVVFIQTANSNGKKPIFVKYADILQWRVYIYIYIFTIHIYTDLKNLTYIILGHVTTAELQILA